jgi:hypothetical protein
VASAIAGSLTRSHFGLKDPDRSHHPQARR